VSERARVCTGREEPFLAATAGIIVGGSFFFFFEVFGFPFRKGLKVLPSVPFP
jgi:hypothetical protein